VYATLAVTALGVGGGYAALQVAPWFLERAARNALEDGRTWRGSFDTLSIDLWTGTVTATGLHLDAQRPQLFLRTLDAPALTARLEPWPLLRGTIALDVDAPGLAAVASPPPPRDGPPPVRSAGWITWDLDLSTIGAHWTWRDGDFTHEAFGVHGSLDSLGTLPGLAHLDLEGTLPGGAHADVEAWMDVTLGQGDAVDLHVRIEDLTPADLTGGDTHYAGVALADGTLDVTVAYTVDTHTQSLPDQDRYMAGDVADLQKGALRLLVDGRDLRVEEFVVDPITVAAVRVQADGGLGPDQVRSAQAWMEDVRLPLRSSLQDALSTGGGGQPTTPEEILELVGPLASSSIHIERFQPTIVDDLHDPPVQLPGPELTVRIEDLQTLDPTIPATLSLTGDIAGGHLVADGTTILTRWPPPTDVSARLAGLDLPTVTEALAPYTTVQARAGQLDGHGRLVVDEGGDVHPELVVTTTPSVVDVAGWRMQTDGIHLDVFGGVGAVHAPDLTGPASSVLTHAWAPELELTWDVDRYLAERALWATARLDAPVVQARRPTEVATDGEAPRAPLPFSLDVTVTDGTLTVTDPSNDLTVHLVETDLTILRLGTASSRAHWELDGHLGRGGALSVVADLDAFAGPGYTSDPLVRAHLLDVDLAAYRDVAAATIGFTGFSGTADVDLHHEAKRTVLHAAGHQLRATTPLLDVTADETIVRAILESEQPPRFAGRMEGVTGRLIADAATRGDGDVPPLPTLRIDRFDLVDGSLAIEHPVQRLDVEDIDIRLRDVTTGSLGETGEVWAHARAGGGELTAAASLRSDVHEGTVRLTDVDLPLFNDLFLDVAGIDVADGHLSAEVDGRLVADGALDLEADLTLVDADILQRADWNRGIGKGLRELGVGALIGLASRDGVARVRLEAQVDDDGFHLNPFPPVFDALAHGLGLRRRLPASPPLVDLTAPASLEGQSLDVCSAIASE
jgi:hypothetical protein